ncbi:hypothetical protein OG21DRAFT_1512961 [Imleria badia]|nr:hypothetical protein OG21DRAFT_1512961 [Imleria badia]
MQTYSSQTLNLHGSRISGRASSLRVIERMKHKATISRGEHPQHIINFLIRLRPGEDPELHVGTMSP